MPLDVENGTLIDVEGDPEGSQEEPDDSDMQDIQRMPGRRRRRGQRLPVEVCQLPRIYNIYVYC